VKALLLCPGQGSQKIGMGKDLAEAFPEAREAFARIDDALQFRLSKVMWEGPEDELTRTDVAQPAILAHTAAVWAVVGEKLHLGTVAAAGHSLGEYSAYVAASSIDDRLAAKLVRRRGELMHEAGAKRKGAMAAVLGLDPATVMAACAQASSADSVVVAANINEPAQTVISGDPEAVVRASELLKNSGAKRVVPLKVSGAFHSPLMAPAQAGLRQVLDDSPITDPAFPVVTNASAEPVIDAKAAKAQLTAQLVSPVRWIECTQRLAALGGEGAQFIEIGPGNVLAGLTKRIISGARVRSIGTAADARAFLEAA